MVLTKCRKAAKYIQAQRMREDTKTELVEMNGKNWDGESLAWN